MTKRIPGILAALLICLVSFQVNADNDYDKVIKEKFNVKPGAMLHIENKFGNVVCSNWEEEAISIVVTIEVEAASQKKADEIFSKIHISISGNERRVEGITTLDHMRGNNQFSINYNINMPKDVNVELSNKYGAMVVEEVEGTSNINMKYGDLNVEKLTNTANKIWLKYGNGDIEYINQGEIEIKYSEFEIEKAGTLEINSKYNDLNIDEIRKLEIESGYDDIEIDEIDIIRNYSKFSDFKIDELGKNLDFDMEYGGCLIKNVKAGFENIKIYAQYAGIEIGFDPKASYRVSVEVNYAGFGYPKTNVNITKKEQSYTSALYEGYVGKNQNTDSKVFIRAKHGDVELH